ncbi:hypothetical protein [Mucilaginibacter lacusdianchii]|uniref:hypothetical protein n=1 Tax=Mucilaginibacter lacusdianchii TaxID=2684211 RepID=UPI00131CF4E8|nr:hypothetical protein [Mucilaginibacter sp. JXJ CY 39]
MNFQLIKYPLANVEGEVDANGIWLSPEINYEETINAINLYLNAKNLKLVNGSFKVVKEGLNLYATGYAEKRMSRWTSGEDDPIS